MDDVIIVGAGIGGLTLGLALHKCGIPCRIFESTAEIKAVGVGINLLPHATKELAVLGLEADLAKVAIATSDATFFNRFGQLIYQEPLGRAAGYEHPQFSIHRGDLQMVLLDAFCAWAGRDRLTTNRHCAGVEQDETGVSVTFSDGPGGKNRSATRGRVAIACDGINSAIRKQFFPEEGEPRYSGVNMWRGVTRWKPMLSGASMVRAGWLSHGKMVIYPIRPAGADGLQLVNWVAEIETPAYRKRDWNRPGAIGDFIGSAGRNSASPFAGLQPFPGLSMHESELGVQAIVDPYARADFFLSFGEEGVDLEEGYITFTSLPAGLVAKVGKMRAAFGKVNSMHNHVLPWIDRPLVTFNLVGGEDGIDDAGISIQRILPAPKGIFLEATGQVFRGDSGTNFSPLFTSSRHSDVSTVAHLRGYGDLTESTNLDLGLSYSRGHNDLGTDFLTNLYGFDATLRWKPLRRAIYHSFIARTEAIWSQRQQLPFTQRSFGMYASADYQLGRRWFVGGRYDYSQRSTNQNLLDRGFSSVLTYWPSEFAQIRGQFRRTQYGEGNDANELLMQVQFSIGAHGAHPF